MSESEYVDRTPMDDPAWVIALVEERNALRARVAEMEAALREIKSHGTNGAGEPWLWSAQVAALAALANPYDGGGKGVGK